MISKFKAFIEKERLFSKEDNILLAVSGGVDSIIMCDLFYKSGLKFGIAHCNFALRDNESDQDEDFVRILAKKYSVPFFKVKFETEKYALKEGISTQMAARKLRYDWFEDIRKQNNFNFISVAHHIDDSIETYFINLIRGTGISGLKGISAKNNLIIRPLLFASRSDILNYCSENKLKFREDISNKSDKYLRNNIRLNIIPKLKNLNPKISQTIIKDMEHFKEMAHIYEEAIEIKRKNIVDSIENNCFKIDINALKKLDPIKTYMFEFLSPYNFNITVIENIIASFDQTSGKKFFSSTHQIIKNREELLIIPLKNEQAIELLISDQLDYIQSPIQLKITREEFSEVFKIPKSSKLACLDQEKLVFPLILRKWKIGDSFYPLGMKTRKKLSDFFVDLKLSLNQKEDVYVMESEREIFWVVGFRIDNRFKITENTKKIYLIES